jgi:hypothetical protein
MFSSVSINAYLLITGIGLESASSQEMKTEANLKRAVLEQAGKCGKTWSEVKRLAGNRVRWRCFTNALCP